jgi:VanZ family protein
MVRSSVQVALMRLLYHWLPALLWAGFIFIGSTDLLSGAHTSRFLGPLLHWMFPQLSPEELKAVQLGIRKAGHVTEYSLLTGLLWRALNGATLGRTRPWPHWRAWFTGLLAVSYAVSDEWHQSFVSSREGSVRDVGIDALGVALALGIIWSVGRFRRRWV